MSVNGTFKVVLLRHGESVWNNENKFCGWYDADLSEAGLAEAKSAGKILKENNFTFDVAFTSVLKRAIKSLYIIQEELDLHWIQVVRHWRLNERHYGDLQGLNKSETAAKHGESQVKIWRRAYDTRPPPMDPSDPRSVRSDPRYAWFEPSIVPLGECLKDTVNRVIPYWHDVIVPTIKSGKKVLIAVHGSSVRSLIKHLDNISDSEISEINVPTGIPLVYELDADMKPLKHYYLADEEKVRIALEKIVAQGKAT